MKTISNFNLFNNPVKCSIDNRGYTLIELLAVTTIIVIVASLIAGILYSTLRGGNKSKVTNEVAQNGNYALSVISNTILLSESVTQIGGVSITDCTANPSGSSIELKQSTGSLITFACQNDTIASTSASSTTYLIDNNTVKADSATCSFVCKQSDNNPYSIPIINITFTLSQLNANATVENSSTAVFTTSTTMRNFNPK